MRMKLLFSLFLIHALSLFAEIREITIIQTADTHSSLFQEVKDGPSWPKMAALIKREIAAAGNGASLLIDCGDAVQGSMASSLTGGKAGLVPILTLPYSVFVPGNHELDFGIAAYRGFCELAGERLLCGNFRVDGQPAPKAYRLFERNGVKIAVMGMQASYFQHWLIKDELAQCHIEKAVEAIRRILPEVLENKPDVIILATHQGWLYGRDVRKVNEVHEIANTFPEIDIILGAHTHRLLPGRKIGLKAWYVQPGAKGEYISVLKVKADTEKHCVVDIQSSLKAVMPDLPEDGEMAAALRPYREKWLRECMRDTGIVLKEDIGTRGRPGVTNEMSALICQAIAEAAGADVVFHNLLSQYNLRAGKVTPADLHKVVPYENRIVTAMMTAEQIEQVMKEQWMYRSSYRFSGPWNALFRHDGDSLKLCEIGGKAPEKGRWYKVAFNSHAAAGSGTSPVLRSILDSGEAGVDVSSVITRDALEAYLRRHCDDLEIRAAWIKK